MINSVRTINRNVNSFYNSAKVWGLIISGAVIAIIGGYKTYTMWGEIVKETNNQNERLDKLDDNMRAVYRLYEVEIINGIKKQEDKVHKDPSDLKESDLDKYVTQCFILSTRKQYLNEDISYYCNYVTQLRDKYKKK